MAVLFLDLRITFPFLLFFEHFLTLVFLPDRFVEYAALLSEQSDAANDVVVLEVRASDRALIRQTAAIVVVSFLISACLAAFEAPIIEHVYTDEVCHLVVHLFTIAQLERQIFFLFVFLRLIRVLT